jgi:glycosyltransferase involved in cell wall biosynthesis
MRAKPPDTTTRVLFSGYHHDHINPGSGYDKVVGDRRDYVCGDGMPFAGYPDTTRLRSVNFLLVDLVTLVRGLRYDTVHYFHAEDTAYLSPWPLRLLGKRIVYTVHNAEHDSWLAPARSPFMRVKQLSLRGAHAIVVLSSSEVDVYSRAFPDKEVRFVPHGFAFDNACEPSAELLKRRTTARRLIVVGTNYRDFDLLERIIAQRGPREVEIHLVVGPNDAVRRRFAGQERVVCHPRLDPASYDELLRESFALLLPLSFATANNALFEAYRCHLPAFVSRIGGTIDYASDGDRSLFSSPEEFWSKYDALAALEPPALRDFCVALYDAARERFSWPTIRGQLAAVYAPAPRGGAGQRR